MTARFHRPFNVRRLDEQRTITIEATDEERAELAEALEVLSIGSLKAEFTLKPWRGEGVRVVGTVSGDVTQACVVTLDPVPGRVEEDFDVRLHPDVAESEEVVVDPDEPDPPERLEGYEVDVGAIALEHFALGLDPYPRAPGVEFDAPADEEEADEPSPFAVLASLKNNPT
ncbi:metal-binding protein [Acuticoccus sediminis]|uniref:Metal-binding protein n=1 Tax=Acuticoccus sediminis TaxID=2184697 RepID=A0A8B2NQ10_9HYPH|nr:DUF177 domain-containing protein [Acuticoccus sediminis]RAH96971.1 metal-binding protein [Acuticoccus sediminis]